MGLAIHFHGTLRSTGSQPGIGRVLQRHATAPDATIHVIDDTEGELGRYLNDDLMDTTGPLKGWIVGLHPQCEPLFFVFDVRGRMASSCKTHFAPLDVHKRIVALLEEVEPMFETFNVIDEGGYWGTHDEAELLARHERLNNLLDQVQGALEHGRPGTRPPVGHALN
jgi:hypothetical protein